MGVMSCDRNGCKSIMCDRYANDYGYICNICFEEIVNSGPTTDIAVFMESDKKPNTLSESIARYLTVFKET